MHAVIVTPGQAGSDRFEDVPDPRPTGGEVVVEVLAVGVDGTDDEIAPGEYGEAPPGDDYLIIGHESLGRLTQRVEGLAEGSLVAGIVRRPDPLPCLNCARDEWDMCLNGQYTERGIKGRHGYLAEYYAELPKYLVAVPDSLAKVGMLVEPTSIAAKAIEQIWRIQQRMAWAPRRAVVTGAGWSLPRDRSTGPACPASTRPPSSPDSWARPVATGESRRRPRRTLNGPKSPTRWCCAPCSGPRPAPWRSPTHSP